MRKVAIMALVLAGLTMSPVFAQEQQAEMTPQVALNNLDAAASQYKGTRQEHIVLQKSVETLTGALTELETLRAAMAQYKTEAK